MPDAGAIAFLQTRLALYDLLQAAYTAPLSHELAEALAESFTVYAALLDLDSPGLDPWEPARDEPEFCRLFVGPCGLIAPPYESVYRSPDGLLMQAQTLAVRAAYRAAGLETAPDRCEPDDHLPLELAFYAHLQRQALSAYQAGDMASAAGRFDDMAQFQADHLSRWIPAFCGRVLMGSTSPFYQSLARLTQASLSAETQVLSALTSLIANEGGAIDERAV